MAKTQDFRVQTTVPDVPGASVASVYADASGRLIFHKNDGIQFLVGSFYTGTLAQSQVGTGTNGPVLPYTLIGLSGAPMTGLGHPSAWLPIAGPANQKWAIPAYLYT